MKKQKRAHKGRDDSPRYSRDNESRLAHRACKLGDVDARNRLVERYRGLVRRMALGYARYHVNLDDLEQEGQLGLLRATESFDPERNLLFGTYAVWWVRSFMQRYVAADLGQRYASPRSTAFGASDDQRSPHRARLPVASLDSTAADAEELPLRERLPADGASPEEVVASKQLRRRVRTALGRAVRELGDQRALVLVERRLLSDAPQTLAAIGREVSLSREGARLLESRLLGRTEAALAI